MVEVIEDQTQEITTTAQPTQVVKTQKVVDPNVQTEHPQRVFEKKKAIFRTYQVIWYILAVIEILLAFRVALKAFAANPYSGFTNLVYSMSEPLAYPFSGILRTSVFGNSVFEWSTIIAAAVYALIAYGIVYLLQIMKPVTPTEVTENVDNP
jgi:uncharacterized protein YggT (Ycf19 family)